MHDERGLYKHRRINNMESALDRVVKLAGEVYKEAEKNGEELTDQQLWDRVFKLMNSPEGDPGPVRTIPDNKANVKRIVTGEEKQYSLVRPIMSIAIAYSLAADKPAICLLQANKQCWSLIIPTRIRDAYCFANRTFSLFLL